MSIPAKLVAILCATVYLVEPGSSGYAMARQPVVHTVTARSAHETYRLHPLPRPVILNLRTGQYLEPGVVLMVNDPDRLLKPGSVNLFMHGRNVGACGPCEYYNLGGAVTNITLKNLPAHGGWHTLTVRNRLGTVTTYRIRTHRHAHHRARM